MEWKGTSRELWFRNSAPMVAHLIAEGGYRIRAKLCVAECVVVRRPPVGDEQWYDTVRLNFPYSEVEQIPRPGWGKAQ